MVFQNSALDQPLSVRDNLRSRAALYGITGQAFEARLQELARLLDFENLLRRTVGKLSGGHARALVPLTAEMQQKAAVLIIKDDLSVRQTELLVKKLTAEKKDAPAKDATAVDYAAEAARELGERLGRPCKIVTGKKKGRIELEYYGVDDLNALLDALHQLKK